MGKVTATVLLNGSFEDGLLNVLVFRNENSQTHIFRERRPGRRNHRHWQVAVFYNDGERFAHNHTDHEKAAGFAERQKESPAVKMARVTQIS